MAGDQHSITRAAPSHSTAGVQDRGPVAGDIRLSRLYGHEVFCCQRVVYRLLILIRICADSSPFAIAVSPVPARTTLRPSSRTTQACIGSRVTSRFDQVLTHQRCIGSASRVTAPEDSSHRVGKVARDDHGAHGSASVLPRLFWSPCWRAPVSGSTPWGRGCAAPGGAGAAAQLAGAQARCSSDEEAARGVSLPVSA